MDERGLPAAHPSLPALPNTLNAQRNQATSTSYSITALSDPYPSNVQPQYTYSSHYEQAYMNSIQQGWAGNYPNLTTYPSPSAFPTQRLGNPQPSSSWHQSGGSRCTYKNCTFTGSPKAVETHKMDRHLIFPPGWAERKEPGWDADPSLKGKAIPIQGTAIVLDSPEVLDAWIAERKKRWPSRARVAEKKMKSKEALARGQLPFDDAGPRGGKRRRPDDSGDGGSHHRVAAGRGRGRGRGGAVHSRDKARPTDAGWKGRGRGGAGHARVKQDAVPLKSEPRPPVGLKSDPSDSSSTSEDDSPAVVSSKPPAGGSSDEEDDSPEVLSSKPPLSEVDVGHGKRSDQPITSLKNPEDTHTIAPVRRVPATQPKKEPFNPFASRPTLLRNLLLPEIRMTVSNLSQAIRFLVDNNFLEGVESTPGEAGRKMIEEIARSDSTQVTTVSIEQSDAL